MILVLMGVAGAGKTTIGGLLSRKLGWPFLDADDFHPPENISKMAAGIPLTDEDRQPWLEALRARMGEEVAAGRSAVFACSGLKKSYRAFLRTAGPEVKLIFLKGDPSLIASRLEERRDHFMKGTMLSSQLEALEEPADCMVVDVSRAPDDVVDEILRRIGGDLGPAGTSD